MNILNLKLNNLNKMKKQIIIIAILIVLAFKCNAQDGLSISVLHDVKLGLGLDKEHGNDKPTLDYIIVFNMDGKQFEWYYFSVQTYYEHAELSSGYFKRYGFNTTWTLNELIVPKLKLGFGMGLGAIHRHLSGGMLTYSGVLEVSYPILKNIDLISRNEWVRRPDLITPKLAYNLSIGIKYKF